MEEKHFNEIGGEKPSRGFIQVYTGNGKGKTTAALGLALRAAGAGKKVFFAQFVKGLPYSETKIIERCLPGIVLRQYGRGCFIHGKPGEKDIEAAAAGMEEISEIVRSGVYDIVVLDEASIAVYFNLITPDMLIELLKSKPEQTEIIVTGRYAPQELIDMADLVTEMKEIKHYYNEGVEAREGIEY